MYCVKSVLVWVGILSGGVLEFSGRIHNIFNGSHVPSHTIMLLYRIKKLSLSYVTLQPTLHNILVDIKDIRARPGTTCSCVAALESHGGSKLPVFVYCIIFPSGRCMTRVRVAGLIFLSGDPGRKQFPVAPASLMAWLTSIFILDVLNRVSSFGYYMLSIE